jgi:hypothetical protein
MQDVKAPAGEWRIGNFFVANDKLEATLRMQDPNGFGQHGQRSSAAGWRSSEQPMVRTDQRLRHRAMAKRLAAYSCPRIKQPCWEQDCVVSPEIPTYKTNMMDVTQPRNAGTDCTANLDLTLGNCCLRQPPSRGRAGPRHHQASKADIANAFNHKQVACKMWALDSCSKAAAAGSRAYGFWVDGTVLPAMLFNDARFDIAAVDSIDIDPEVAPVADPQPGSRRPVPGADGRYVRTRLCGRAARPDGQYELRTHSRSQRLACPASARHECAAAIERLFQRADAHQLRAFTGSFRGHGGAAGDQVLRRTADKNYTRFMLIELFNAFRRKCVAVLGQRHA